MKRTLVTLVFISIYSSLFAQGRVIDTTQGRAGLMLGFNQFPGYYIPWETHRINEVGYGYNFGYFFKGSKFNLRAGVNGNIFRSTSLNYKMEYTFGYEVGLELPLLSSKRKWLVTPGVLFYQGWWLTRRFVSSTNSSTHLFKILGVGPNLMIGHRIGDRWIICSETSISIGAASYETNGVTYLREKPTLFWWKFIGMGVRYYLN